MTPTPTPEVREPTNAEIAALSKALREGGNIVTTAGILKEAARMMIAASPQLVVAPSDLSGEDGLSKTIPDAQVSE